MPKADGGLPKTPVINVSQLKPWIVRYLQPGSNPCQAKSCPSSTCGCDRFFRYSGCTARRTRTVAI